MNNHHRRSTPWLTQLILMALITLPHHSNAADFATRDQATEAQRAVVFNIPRQAADDSLPVFGQQADVTVIYPFERVKDHHTNRLQGEYSVTHAVAILLDNTGLQAQFSPEGHLVITQMDETKGKRMNTNKRKTVLATMVGLFAAGGMTTAIAQDKMGESARAQGVLDEIIVTAQKREQNLQDVALAVTAVTADDLEKRGFKNVSDLQFSVPGLTVGESITGAPNITMRGIGIENVFAGGDPGVPLHIDGHYIQSASYMLRDFLDVERVEVLRGPQGTLYGRNAIGGNVNIISKRPTEHVEGQLSVDLGSYNKRLVQGVLSGGLTDSIRGRLVVSDEKRDGFTENISTLGGKDLDDSDYTSARATLEVDVSDNILATIGLYYFDDASIAPTVRMIDPYPDSLPGFVNYFELNGAGINPTVLDPRKVKMNDVGQPTNEGKGISADFDFTFDNFTLRSLSSFNDSHQTTKTDDDSSDVVTAANGDSILAFETFSQEFQLVSANDSSLSWVAGVFYYTEDSEWNKFFIWDNLFVAGGPRENFRFDTILDSSSLGVYGQLDYAINDKIEIVFGLRYNDDEKDIVSEVTLESLGLISPDGTPLVFTNEGAWSEISGKIGLNYSVTDEIMAYLSYSTGYKAGGYNSAFATIYDPETVAATELGIKSTWLDGHAKTNITVFHYDYEDVQEFKVNEDGTSAIINAAEAIQWGVEIEQAFRMQSGLQIDFSLAYLDAEFDEFDTVDDVFNTELGLQDLSGNSLARSPKWKAYIGVQNEWMLQENGSVTVRIDSSWSAKQYSTHFNRASDVISGYSRVNASLSWISSDELWEGLLYGKNLDGDDDISNITDSSGLVGIPPPRYGQYLEPRTFGVKVSRHF